MSGFQNTHLTGIPDNPQITHRGKFRHHEMYWLQEKNTMCQPPKIILQQDNLNHAITEIRNYFFSHKKISSSRCLSHRVLGLNIWKSVLLSNWKKNTHMYKTCTFLNMNLVHGFSHKLLCKWLIHFSCYLFNQQTNHSANRSRRSLECELKMLISEVETLKG